MEYGIEIAADNGGKKLPWLSDDEEVMCHWSADIQGGPYEVRHVTGWTDGFRIRLPADHWAYPVLAAGFVPWAGGDEAPGDWEPYDEVLFADGSSDDCSGHWDWRGYGAPADRKGALIIGYKPRAEQAEELAQSGAIDWTQPVETVDGIPVTVVRVDENGGADIKGLPEDAEVGRHGGETMHWSYGSDGTVSNPWLPDLRNAAPTFKAGDYVVATRDLTGHNEGDVFQMTWNSDVAAGYRPATPAEIEQYLGEKELEAAYSGDPAVFIKETPADTVTLPKMTENEAIDRWGNGYDWHCLGIARELGLIRTTTPLEVFAQHHGDLDNNQRDIVEAFIAWQETQA